jgi:uncharacterized membrane protein YvlD (DUF360 family)
MDLLRRIVDFYRVQIELIWNWRRGRRQLIWRALISFFVAAFSLALTAFLLPGLRVDSIWALAAAVIVIGLLSALVRPLLLALLAPLSLVLMLGAALAYQVAVILALVPLVPGVHLAAPIDAVFAAAVFAVINTLLSWLLSLDTDDSYYSMFVRRLLSRRRDAIHSKEPGFVIVQIDGLSHLVMQQMFQAGRVPIMSRWLNYGRMRLASWTTLLPSQTSASQAGILFGSNDDIPAFRWFDKATKTMFVSNRAADAEDLEQRLVASGHEGLLRGGASIGNLVSGGAERSYLTMSTMRDPAKGIGHSRSYYGYFLSPYGFAHTIVLAVAEMAKEVFQARRAKFAGVAPISTSRGFPYPVLRAMTNVVLRPLVTSLVIEEMLHGTPVIYVTYTDYDEIAHHSGPARPESLDALDGVDSVLGSLARAAEDAPRPYHFVVLSDHGQTLGATFRQRYGKTLLAVIRQLMGGADEVAAAVDELDEWRVANTFVTELTHARGAARVATSALNRRERRRERRAARQATVPAPENAPELPDVVVCPSGNLALVYFPDIEGRATLEQLNERFEGMVEALANHPGVGLLGVRSAEHGPLVVGRSGVRQLDDGKVTGEDPLKDFGEHAADALRRLDAMDNSGDLALISMFDPETLQVAAFEELIGSHGGLGGPQTDAMLLFPADWDLDHELVGADAVYTQLRAWMKTATPDNAVMDPDALAEVAEAAA